MRGAVVLSLNRGLKPKLALRRRASVRHSRILQPLPGAPEWRRTIAASNRDIRMPLHAERIGVGKDPETRPRLQCSGAQGKTAVITWCQKHDVYSRRWMKQAFIERVRELLQQGVGKMARASPREKAASTGRSHARMFLHVCLNRTSFECCCFEGDVLRTCASVATEHGRSVKLERRTASRRSSRRGQRSNRSIEASKRALTA